MPAMRTQKVRSPYRRSNIVSAPVAVPQMAHTTHYAGSYGTLGARRGRVSGSRARLTGRYATRGYRRGGEEVKTLDLRFSGAQNNVYTVDTEPLQMLNISSSTDVVQSLSNIQQGAGISQRIGNKVSLKSLRLRLRLTPNGPVNDTQVSHARVILFYDRQPNGGYLNVSQILGQSLQSNTVAAGTVDDNLNPNLMDRIQIIRDWTFCMPPYDAAALANVVGPTGTGDDMPWHINEYIKLNDLECCYNATSNPGVIANSTTGSLQILTIGTAAIANTGWTLAGGARLRFRDN